MVLVGVVLMRGGQWSAWAVPHIGYDCLKTDLSAKRLSFFDRQWSEIRSQDIFDVIEVA